MKVELKGYNEKDDEDDEYIGIAVDGEIYKVKGGISLNVYLDP